MVKQQLPTIEILDMRHLIVKDAAVDPLAAVLLKIGWATYHGVRLYKDGRITFPPWKSHGDTTIPVVQFPPHIHDLIEKDCQRAWVLFEKTAHSAFSR